MLRRLGIRGKILATLAVPVLVLGFAAVFISAQSLREVQDTRAISSALGALQVNRVYIDALQKERAAGVLHAGEIRFERRLPFLDESERLTRQEEAARAERAAERAEDFTGATESTDATRTRAEARLRDLDYDTLDPLVKEAVDRVLETRERIEEVRASVTSGNLAPNLVDRQYTLIISQDVDLIEQFAGTIDNRALGTYLSAYALVDRTVEHISNERGFGLYAIEGDGRETSARDYLVGLFPEATSTHARADQAILNLGDPDIEMPAWGAGSEAFTDFMNLRSRLQASTAQDWEALSEDTWVEQATIEIEALQPTLAGLWSAVEQNASASQSGAQAQATLTVLLALLAVGASVAVALLIGRTIVVPLTRLTEAAGEVRDQLPRLVEQVATPGEGPDLSLVQIPVDSEDEVGRLAAAFNEVNQTTVEVAQEQAALRGSIAEMFVNVARRDQVLLNRQLSFLDTLEREEEDPNTLANLFRLDHLATRMRRNAESLLVLAGIDSGRRVRGSMTLSDVVRTASSEIEQYERINLLLGVDPHMHGFNSLPAAHLIAEILENATVFSEPGTMVDVVTSAEIEFITVAVIDRGLGMSAEDIKQANERVRETTASEVVGAQRLGMHVVGRIASRLGTRVVFARAEDQGGTEVRIRFPRALFVDDAHDAQPTSGGRMLTSAEIGAAAPAAVPVDLDALTDGQTGLGLPRRRASEPAAAPAGAPEGPVAPAEPAAPAAATPQQTPAGLPSRRNIVLPEVATPQLAPDVAAEAAAGWAPQAAAPAAGGLPSRSRGASAAVQSTDDAPAAPPRPAAAELAPEERSGMFAGFRRGTEVPGAEAAPADAAPAQEAPAPSEADEPQLVVPGFQDDDDAPEQAGAFATPEAPPAPAVPELEPEPAAWDAPPETPAEAPAAVPQWDGSPYAPAEAPQQAAPETPVWDEGTAAAAPATPGWGQPAPDPAPASWEQPAPEPAPASWAEPAPAAAETPAAPAWDAAPTDAPAPTAPEPPAPAATEAAATEAAPAAPAWHEGVPATQTWGPGEPAWTPTEPSTPFSTPSAGSPYGGVPSAPAAEAQYPAFSPDAGYAAPAPAAPAWEAETPAAPAWQAEAPAAPTEPAPQEYDASSAPGAAGWSPAAPAQHDWPAPPVAQPAPAPAWTAADAAQPSAPEPAAPPVPAQPAAADPGAPAAMAPLPTFSDLVGQEPAPSRRSRRGASSSAKPSWAERRAAKREAARERAEAKAQAKAEARAQKKGKTTEPAPALEPAAPSAPTPGFLSQPTSIAALRAGDASPAPTAPAAPAAAAAPAWSAPAPEATPAAPQQPAASAWTAPPVSEPAAPAAAYQPQAAQEQPFSPTFQPSADPAPAPAPAAPAARAPEPATSFTPGQAAWAPDGGAASGARQFGVLDDEVAAMLALRSDIQEQALSELSQLSAYRPKAVQEASSLARRTPTAIPSAPEMAESSGTPKERDPEALRSRLSNFQSGASRGRRAHQQPPTDSAPSSDGAAPQANGSAEHATPGGPPSDTTQEAQTW